MLASMRSLRAPLALAALGLLAPGVRAAQGCNSTFTSDADFDRGVLLNVNHNAPNNDQLQLNATAAPLPFVYIACSARGTAVRIDINTGAVLGEYFTSPNGMGRDPSRTTVDKLGNVWVSNRAESGFSGGQFKGSVTRIGIVIGGTRGTKDAQGNFTPDPNGEYLQPPFQYSTCRDRDGDGLIRTSRGLANILAWTNAGSADTDGGVTTAEDECIVNYVRITGTAARTVAIDANNDVWTGGLGDLDHEKLDGVTGQPVPGTQFNLGCGGYGGLVDGNNVLWSARGGSGLLRYDATAGTGVSLGNGMGDYGLGIDPITGHIWHSFLGGGNVVEIDSAGTQLNVYGHGEFYAQGVAVDGSGNVWVAHSLFGSTTVGHLRTDGTFVGNVPLVTGTGPTGVAVDSNGKVWVASISTNNAQRIDPAAGAAGGGGFPIGAVDLTVDLGPGAGPYNYSDMTGFVAIGTTSPSGTWSVVHDGGAPGTGWGNFNWNSIEPAGTSITVEVRADDQATNLPTKTFVAVSKGVSICGGGVAGQFLEIRVTLSRPPSVNTSPVLLDLTANCCAGAPTTLTCPANVTETWTTGPPAQIDPALTGLATYFDSCDPNPTLSYSDSFDPGNQPGEPETIVTRTWTLTDTCGANLSCQQTITLLSPSGGGGAHLDAKPGSCPNVVRLNSSGNTVFSLANSFAFDPRAVDLTTVRLSRSDGVGVRLPASWIGFLDIATPYYGKSGGCHTLRGDGSMDMVLELPTQSLRRAFQLQKLPAGTLVELSLKGKLLDGTAFEARDFVEVQPK